MNKTPSAGDVEWLDIRMREATLRNALAICRMVMTDEQTAKVVRNLNGLAAIGSLDRQALNDTSDSTEHGQAIEMQEAAAMRAFRSVLEILQPSNQPPND